MKTKTIEMRTDAKSNQQSSTVNKLNTTKVNGIKTTEKLKNIRSNNARDAKNGKLSINNKLTIKMTDEPKQQNRKQNLINNPMASKTTIHLKEETNCLTIDTLDSQFLNDVDTKVIDSLATSANLDFTHDFNQDKLLFNDDEQKLLFDDLNNVLPDTRSIDLDNLTTNSNLNLTNLSNLNSNLNDNLTSLNSTLNTSLEHQNLNTNAILDSLSNGLSNGLSNRLDQMHQSFTPFNLTNLTVNSSSSNATNLIIGNTTKQSNYESRSNQSQSLLQQPSNKSLKQNI